MRHASPYLLLGVLCLSGCLGDFAGCSAYDDEGDLVTEPDDEDPTPDPTILADLAELSTGECPDMTAPGISVFNSGGEDRKIGLAFPTARPANMPLVFAFHGLNIPESQPVEFWLDMLQAEAEARNAIIVSPEGLVQDMPLAGEYLGWGFLGEPEQDLALFDDLRTCIADEFDVDLNRLTLLGHSGGALWSSLLMMSRTNAVTAISEFSGGSDFSIPLFGGPFVSYVDPGREVPMLLVSGGANDIWPGGSVEIINFETTSDNLQASFLGDGYKVARCKHELGHMFWPPETFSLGLDWATGHVFGEPSPFSDDDLIDGCVLP